MTSRRRSTLRSRAATPDVTFSNITYTAPLAVQNLAVEKGIAERSFIQYLDVDFNQTARRPSSALQEPGERAGRQQSATRMWNSCGTART